MSTERTQQAACRNAHGPEIHVLSPAVVACDQEWEAAYRAFETAAEEQRKFLRRFLRLGLQHWDRRLRVIDLFCGRGGGLMALEMLGFMNLEGVDLSESLLREYRGPAQLYVADCRDLSMFEPSSRDVAVVQGGLHHLSHLPQDLDIVLAGIRRLLRPGGRFVVVEPWSTPFLSFAHALCRSPLARLSRKLSALQRMTEHERDTYYRWLDSPAQILAAFDRYFLPMRRRIAWGKLAQVLAKGMS